MTMFSPDLPPFQGPKPPTPESELTDAVADLASYVRDLGGELRDFTTQAQLMAAVIRGAAVGKPDWQGPDPARLQAALAGRGQVNTASGGRRLPVVRSKEDLAELFPGGVLPPNVAAAAAAQTPPPGWKPMGASSSVVPPTAGPGQAAASPAGVAAAATAVGGVVNNPSVMAKLKALWGQTGQVIGGGVTRALLKLSAGGRGGSSLPAWVAARELSHAVVSAPGKLLESASPAAAATLTGSGQLLAATLGRDLIPASARLSKALQEMSSYFHDHPGPRAFVTWTVTGAAGLAALSGAVRLLKPGVVDLANVLLTLKGKSGLTWLGRGVAAAGAIATAMQYSSTTSTLRDAELQRRAAERSREQAGERTDRGQFTQQEWDYFAPLRQELQVLPPDRRRARVAELAEESRGRMAVLQKRIQDTSAPGMFGIASDTSRPGAVVKGVGRLLYYGLDEWATGVGNLFRDRPEMSAAQRAIVSNQRAQTLLAAEETRFNMLRSMLKDRGQVIDHPADAKAAAGKDQDAARQLLLSFGGMRAPVATGDIADAWATIQIRALEQDPLQQKIQQQQLENLNVLIEQLDTLKSIDEKVGRPHGVIW